MSRVCCVFACEFTCRAVDVGHLCEKQKCVSVALARLEYLVAYAAATVAARVFSTVSIHEERLRVAGFRDRRRGHAAGRQTQARHGHAAGSQQPYGAAATVFCCSSASHAQLMMQMHDLVYGLMQMSDLIYAV